MALDNIFGIAGSALNAQTVRMNTTASNLANAGTVASSDKEAFRGKRVNFKTIMETQLNTTDLGNKGGVKVSAISDDPKSISRMSDPGNPAADKDGYVEVPNVNRLIEMMDMREAQRSYEANMNVISTSRQMVAKTLELL